MVGLGNGKCSGKVKFIYKQRNIMRDQHYKNKTMRIADKTWEKLKEKRAKSGKTWNLFIWGLIKPEKKKKFRPENSNDNEASPQETRD